MTIICNKKNMHENSQLQCPIMRKMHVPEFVGVSRSYGENVLKFFNLRRSHNLTPSRAAVWHANKNLKLDTGITRPHTRM